MKALIVTNQTDTIENIMSLFDSSFEVKVAGNRLSGKEQFINNTHDIVYYDITCLNVHGVSAKDTFIELKKIKPTQKVIILSPQENIREAMELIKAGANDYLTYPIDPLEIKTVTEQTIALERKIAKLEATQDHFWQEDFRDIVDTKSEKMAQVYEMAKDVAPTNSTVLINGETGVGKGVLARLLHHHSSRKDQQFIHVHCGAIAETLIESELFGHEKGAFTGAIKRKLGKFELAHNGTIFLDEISTLSSVAQIKLLQVMQDSIFQRVGGETDIKVNVRIIAATNESLKQLSDKGLFRSDLYYRLNVFPMELPPLRERAEDLDHITELFIKRMQTSSLKQIDGIQPETLSALKKYSWPGNIRELENLIERAYILEKSSTLGHSSFPLEIFDSLNDQAILPLNLDWTLAEARSRNNENFEHQYLKELLTKMQGKINLTAEKAGISVRQLNNLMNKYNLHKEEFKPKQKPNPSSEL